jgi:hypothetical protein
MCQLFIDAAIEPTCGKYPKTYGLHYMDNILITHHCESNLFFQLHSLVKTKLYLCFVSHLCSHSNLPSPLTDGNAQEDNLVSGLALGLSTQTAAPVEAA